MFLYLSVNTFPYIAFALNCCTIYMFFHKHFHEVALNQIGWYLKLTRDRGLVFNTNRELLNIDTYPDSYFYGICGNWKPTYPAFVNSRTGYVIKFSHCPVLW